MVETKREVNFKANGRRKALDLSLELRISNMHDDKIYVYVCDLTL